MLGPYFDLGDTAGAELTFWYHMYGSAMGTLNIEVSEDYENWTNVWSMSGDQGNTWYQANVDLTPYRGKTINIKSTGVTGSSYRSDMAIDDIEITVTPEISCGGDEDCDDGDFCNGNETCSATLGCQAGSDPCLGNYCDEATDTCYECEEDSECDDGLFCTGTETCVSGVCQFSSDPCPGQGCDEENDECVASPNDQMHVNTIEVTKQSWWVFRRGIAKVQIMDTKGSPVAAATVIGRWSGGANDTDQLNTNANGEVNIYSNWRRGDATFTFCVTDISKEGWDYNSVITCGNTY
jgi:hypothetical protein